MRISDWSSDVCSSDLLPDALQRRLAAALGDGVFNIPGTRRQFRVASRVALVSRGRQGAGGSLGLDPGLAALPKGWTLSPPPLRARVDDLSAVMEALAGRRGTRLPRHTDFTAAAIKHHTASDDPLTPPEPHNHLRPPN